jgi:hypothetical protein
VRRQVAPTALLRSARPTAPAPPAPPTSLFPIGSRFDVRFDTGVFEGVVVGTAPGGHRLHFVSDNETLTLKLPHPDATLLSNPGSEQAEQPGPPPPLEPSSPLPSAPPVADLAELRGLLAACSALRTKPASPSCSSQSGPLPPRIDANAAMCKRLHQRLSNAALPIRVRARIYRRLCALRAELQPEALHADALEVMPPAELNALFASTVATLPASSSLLTIPPPPTVRAALDGVNGPGWRAAIQAELDSMTEFGVWELVPLPKGAVALGCKWVFKVKRDREGLVDKLKARLTFKGYRQVEGRDYSTTWAPTGRLRAARWLLAEASSDASIQTAQWDCSCAFLHGDIDHDIYMQQPPGFVEPGKEDHVCHLLKAIYGTKQASHLFYKKVREELLALPSKITGLTVTQSTADDCVYVLRRGDAWLKILTHVDDFLVTHNARSLYDTIFAAISNVFKITDYGGGPATKFCGVRINQRACDGAYLLDQQLYIEELLDRLDLSSCREELSPEATGTKARLKPHVGSLSSADATFMAEVPYREAVGALWWLARCTRFDIFRAVQQVAQFVSAPAPEHWRAVRRIYGYLKRTSAVPLVLRASPSSTMSGHCDSDWAGCTSTGKSQTGFIVRFGDALVGWRALKQSDTAQSTCEAEYIAANELTKELVWWRRFLRDMGAPTDKPLSLFCDNKAAISLSKHSCNFEATKHIRHRYHYIRECVANGKVAVSWCKSADQWADVLTKNCAIVTFRRIVSHLLGSPV